LVQGIGTYYVTESYDHGSAMMAKRKVVKKVPVELLRAC
jgi:hypothetical protein